jgi:hypothetical protein
MDRLYEICDEMASTEQFVTLRSIMEKFHGKSLSKLEGDKEYGRLKKQLNRNDHAVEYKNGHDFRDGFRYKHGYEFYFRSEEERNELLRKDGDERRLFLTGGLQMLFDGKSAQEHLVELECVSELQNLSLVKGLVKYLGKWVISFKYVQGYQNLMNITVHPHLLKEYNSRWFLFGYVHQDNDTWEIVNFALDRIVYNGSPNDILVHVDVPFKKAPKDYYTNYFKDIVGVTKYDEEEIEQITIRTVDFKVHHLLRTKPLHSSQIETMPFDEENGCGEFTICVIPNIELQARLLGYGQGLYVIEGPSFRKKMQDVISQLSKLYK